MSQQDMDMSVASSNNSIHVYPTHYPSTEQQYVNLNGQYHGENNRRLVRIRNPQYETPNASMGVYNYVHPYNDHNEYHVASSPSLRVKSGHQSSISATPRRGPWRYMEVNNQYIPPNSHPQISNNAFSSYVPSQDTLSDEFDEEELDPEVSRRQTIEESIPNETEIQGYMPRRFTRTEEIDYDPLSSPPSHVYNIDSYGRYSPKKFSHKHTNPNHNIPSCSSPRTPVHARISPRQYHVRSTHAERRLPQMSSPSYHARDCTNPQLITQKTKRPNANSSKFSRDPVYPKVTNENIRKRVISDFSPTHGKYKWQDKPISSGAPFEKHLPNSTSVVLLEPMLQNHEITHNDISSNRHERLGIDEDFDTSPRRNSTPFLHRPRTLFHDKFSKTNHIDIHSDNCNLSPSQANSKAQNELENSCQSTQPCIKETSNRVSNRYQSKNKSKSYTKRICKTQKATVQKNSDEENSESQHTNCDHGQKVQAQLKETTKSPKIQKELASLLSSNSFHGILNENQNRERRPIRLKAQANKTNQGQLSNSVVKPHCTSVASKHVKNITNESVDAFGSKDSNVETRAINRTDTSLSTTDDGGVFKLPLPPCKQLQKPKIPPKNNSCKDAKRLGVSIENSKMSLHDNDLFLKNWTPKLKGKKLLFEGDLLTFG